MYKIINKTEDNRQFRIKKTAEGFFIRPGEELIVPFEPIVWNPNTFEVINLDNIEQPILDVIPKKKRIKQEDKK